mgnify:CR=1 FL=1
MKSKLIATMVKAIIDLRLLVGYKLVTLDSWTLLKSQLLSENFSTTKKIDELRGEVLYWQDLCSQRDQRISLLSIEAQASVAQLEKEKETIQASVTQLKKDKDKLVKDFHDASAKLMDATNEVEIANSEMLILRDSLDEGTELSKQLKEALDRWTS